MDPVYASRRTYPGKANRAVAVLTLLLGLSTVGAPTSAQKFTTVYAFTGGSDGANPLGGVVLDKKGNLYGTAAFDGNLLAGTAFRLHGGIFTLLHTFTGVSDGEFPAASMVRDKKGNLYGTTSNGGQNINFQHYNFGTVFKIDKHNNLTVLHAFTGNSDGAYPQALLRDAQGNFYGTTQFGGDASWPSGDGVVYKIDTKGNFSVLHTFTGGADGGSAFGGLVQDSQGNLYGTANSGGANRRGVVYKIDTSGNYSVLHDFAGAADGSNPWAGLTPDGQGNFYGTTTQGGAFDAGAIYKITSSGALTLLYSFTGGAGGNIPYGAMALDKKGNLYGTTSNGGADGFGLVFKLDTTGAFTVLHTFTGGLDGAQPWAAVVLDKKGNLYGTTYLGGTIFGQEGRGVVFKIAP